MTDSLEHALKAAEVRAEKAERALSALCDQVEHQGCAGSQLGSTFYTCSATAPCGLCSLRHRAEKAERALFDVRNALDLDLGLMWAVTSETVADQAKQMAAMAGKVVRERDEARAALAKMTDERNALRSALTDSQQAVVESMRERIASTAVARECGTPCYGGTACKMPRGHGGVCDPGWVALSTSYYVTRAELVEALRAAAKSMPNPASGVALERTAAILASELRKEKP